MSDIINSIIDTIHIELLRDLFPKSVYIRLVKTGVSTIGEFKNLDRDRYIRIKCPDPLNLNRFDELQEMCHGYPGKIVHHLVLRFHDDEVTMSSTVPFDDENSGAYSALTKLNKLEIEQLSELIPKSVYSRLTKLGVKTVAEVKNLDRQEYINLQCEHPLNIKKFDKFQDTCLRKPGVLMQQLVTNFQRFTKSNKYTKEQMRLMETGNVPENGSLDQIDLVAIKGIIPKSVYNRLLKLGVLTIGTLKNLDRNKYISLQCNHPLNISKFDELQHLIRVNPAFVVRYIGIQNNMETHQDLDHARSDIELVKTIVGDLVVNLTSRREKVDAIQLKQIQGLITKSVFKRLSEMNIKTVGELRTTSQEEYTTYVSSSPVGLRYFNEIKELIDRDSVMLVSYSEKQSNIKTIPDVADDTLEFPRILEIIVDQYYQHIKENTDRLVVYKRYGIGEKRKYTLEEIGIYCSLSKERVRQILVRNLRNLSMLFSGDYISKYKCECSSVALRLIRDFKADRMYSQIVSIKDLNDRYQHDFGKNPYFELYLESTGISVFEDEDQEIYLVNSPLKVQQFEELVRHIRKTLKHTIVPVSEFDLTVKVKRIKSFKKVSNPFLVEVFGTLTDIERTSDNEDLPFYQISLPKLNSLQDQAYRVLHENKKSLHFREIHREISHRIAKTDPTRRITLNALQSQLVSSEKIVPAGRSGYWSLKSSGLTNQTVLELIVQSLHTFNCPCTAEEIVANIKKDRPFVRDQTVRALLGSSKSNFLRLKGGRYILKDWATQYRDSFETPSRRNRSTALEIYETVVSCFSQNDYSDLRSSDILKFLDKELGIRNSTGYKILKEADYLEKKQTSRQVVYSLTNDYKSQKPEDETKVARNPVAAKIAKTIHVVLDSDHTDLKPLKDIVKILEQKYRFKKSTVYRVIETCSDFEKTTYNTGKLYLHRISKTHNAMQLEWPR